MTTMKDNKYGDDGKETISEAPNDEISSAAAYLSSTGPCKGFGDLYLTCVATAGLGMCRSLRSQFEHCAKAHHVSSVKVLEELGTQLCSHIPNDKSNDSVNRERLQCAADLMNQQLMHSYSTAMASVSKDTGNDSTDGTTTNTS